MCQTSLQHDQEIVLGLQVSMIQHINNFLGILPLNKIDAPFRKLQGQKISHQAAGVESPDHKIDNPPSFARRDFEMNKPLFCRRHKKFWPGFAPSTTDGTQMVCSTPPFERFPKRFFVGIFLLGVWLKGRVWWHLINGLVGWGLGLVLKPVPNIFPLKIWFCDVFLS